jgi:1-acyl-sn-glycerol-3-phosphate acyltransferase
VSFVDALLIGGAVRRPIRFVMYYKIYNLPVLNFIFRTAGDSDRRAQRRHPDLRKAFTRIAQYLKDGELVCIFPEGKLTADGEINEFKGGTRILEETPVPVIPLALQGCGAVSSVAIRTRASSSDVVAGDLVAGGRWRPSRPDCGVLASCGGVSGSSVLM